MTGKRNWTPEELIAFEDDIKTIYNEGKITAPIHLSGGSEVQLIEIFTRISPHDWVFAGHRSHYLALLHGIDSDWLKNEILAGHSIHLENAEHHFVTSAIVGGCLPIAVGVAMGLKRANRSEHVWCFIGDMCAESGIFYECTKYSARNNLNIHFVVGDNGLSTNSPTQMTWGIGHRRPDIIRFVYLRTQPHIGTGTFINFS